MIYLKKVEDDMIVFGYQNINEYFAFTSLLTDHLFVDEPLEIREVKNFNSKCKDKITKVIQNNRSFNRIYRHELIVLNNDFLVGSFMFILTTHIKNNNLNNYMVIL